MSLPPVKATLPHPASQAKAFGPMSRAGFMAKPVNGPIDAPMTAISKPINNGARGPRNTTGVRGIRLGEGDKVVSLIVPRGDGAILTATQNGYGKRTAVEEYPTKSRATKGVISIKVTERNGLVVGAVQVDDCDQIMMITDAGTLVRTRVSEISIVGRNTQGVILIRTAEGENVVGLQRVAEPVDDEDLDAIDGSAAEGDDEIAPEVVQNSSSQFWIFKTDV